MTCLCTDERLPIRLLSSPLLPPPARLYTEDAFRSSLPPHPVPELQRSDLTPLVLQLKALGIDNLMRFDFPAPPPPEALLRSLEVLYALGFLDSDARLTHPAGKQAAELPLVSAQGLVCLSESPTPMALKFAG